MNRISAIVGLLAKCAILCAILLLLSNLRPPSTRAHDWIGALPLALIGVAYIVLQCRMKPDWRTLLKRIFLAGTFILWAIDQLLPTGRVATFIGDAVVAAYVLDLFWMIQDQQTSSGPSKDA